MPVQAERIGRLTETSSAFDDEKKNGGNRESGSDARKPMYIVRPIRSITPIHYPWQGH
jgi:hypothetical protein